MTVCLLQVLAGVERGQKKNRTNRKPAVQTEIMVGEKEEEEEKVPVMTTLTTWR